METYFTSDTHFGHKNIIGYCDRPFDSVSLMNQEMIDNWNALVGPKDLIYHLGDFHFGTRLELDLICQALNGRIILVAGNHDKDQTRKCKRFEKVVDYLEINHNRQKLVLCHFPFLTWNKMHRGSWHLHGHCHGGINRSDRKVPNVERRIDVGVDTNEFYPYHVSEFVV